MGLPVVTVASGGLPIVEATRGTPVTEAANGRGVPVTKVVGKPGLPVVFETIGVAVPFAGATWNAADKVAVTLSNGNLTMISTAAISGVRATTGYSTGKYYFEFSPNPWFFMHGFGVALSTATLNSAATNGLVFVNHDGAIAINNVVSPTVAGAMVAWVGIAVDATSKLIWFRNSAGGNWNNNASNNPATGVGGVNISALAGALYPVYVSNATGGDVATANFGASAFVGAVPAGFTSGWPV